jgi:YidC/Oxa1 family membrane protein insertase
MLLTKTNTFIIGPVATLLGFIMNAIFIFLSGVFHVENLGLCIILFTIIIYAFMTPLTIKQQKFSKLSAQMNPELQKIQKKYKGKQDQASMLKMNEETKEVYAKYGVSPSGSCLQMLIQLPILFALYRVIWNIPAYVGSVKEAFMPLVEALLENPASQKVLDVIAKANSINFEKLGYAENSIVDTLYKCKPADWDMLMEKFPDLSSLIQSTEETMNGMNHFFGLNIADAPLNIIQSAFQNGAYLLMIGALLIPILSGLTQWLSVKLMSSTTAADTNKKQDQSGTMEQSMKMMNNIMPIMSVVFCFTLPAGLGIYWVASAVVRMVQQIFVNRHLDKIDLDSMIEKNMEKYNEKRKKQGLPTQRIVNQAAMNTKSIEKPKKPEMSEEERQKQIEKSTEYYKTHAAKPGSIASKARMVEQYNEKTNKKK